MKKLRYAFLLLASFALPARSQFLSAEVGLNGLTCSMCSLGTDKALKKLPFIEAVHVDLNALDAHITFKKGVNVSIDDIRKTIEDAGFSVRTIEAVLQFDSVTVGKDFHYSLAGDTYHFIGVDHKTLEGPVKLRFVDKDYVTAKEFAQFAKQ